MTHLFVVVNNLDTTDEDFQDLTDLFGTSLMCVMACILEMIAKIVLEFASVDFYFKLLSKAILNWHFYYFK
jgi:hypothetical protein